MKNLLKCVQNLISRFSLLVFVCSLEATEISLHNYKKPPVHGGFLLRTNLSN